MSEAPRDLPPGAPRGPAITIEVDGQPMRAFAGEPVGVGLLAAGVRVLSRSPKYHRPRGLFCLEGHCGACLMRIDGRPNRRACLVPAREGLVCERQNAFPDADVDLLRAADWLFPKGMDHHRLMTGSRIGNDIFLKLVRQMGGSGTLPDEPAADLPEVRDLAVDLCIVGAGPAGLAAARAAAETRPAARILVVDEGDVPGGSLLAEPDGVARGRALADAAVAAGAEISVGAQAIAFYPEDGPGGLLAVARADGMIRVTAARYLYATGGYDQNLAFPNNDRPGVLSARACGRLAFRFGVRPGPRVVIVTDAPNPYAETLSAGLARAGVPTERVPLDGLIDRGVDLDEEVLAVAALPAPASELHRQHGARVRLAPERGGFAVEVDDRFGTTIPRVWAVGDVTGYRGPAAAARDGEAAGRAVFE